MISRFSAQPGRFVKLVAFLLLAAAGTGLCQSGDHSSRLSAISNLALSQSLTNSVLAGLITNLPDFEAAIHRLEVQRGDNPVSADTASGLSLIRKLEDRRKLEVTLLKPYADVLADVRVGHSQSQIQATYL